MNFSQELKQILSHPVTSKQPPEIVQIHMRHPVFHFCATKVSPMRAHQVLLIRTTPNMSNQKFWAEKKICNGLTASSMIIFREEPVTCIKIIFSL